MWVKRESDKSNANVREKFGRREVQSLPAIMQQIRKLANCLRLGFSALWWM